MSAAGATRARPSARLLPDVPTQQLLDSIERVGITTVALVVVAWAFWWLLRTQVAIRDRERADLVHQRDEAIAGWRAQVVATEQANKAIERLTALVEGHIGHVQ